MASSGARVGPREMALARIYRGGLAFKAHRLLYHSTLGLTVIKKKKKREGSIFPEAGTAAQHPPSPFDASSGASQRVSSLAVTRVLSRAGQGSCQDLPQGSQGTSRKNSWVIHGNLSSFRHKP